MHGLIRAGSALLVFLCLSGCSLIRSGPIEPTPSTAVVRAGQWGKVYRSGYVELVSLNGVQSGWRLRSDLAVTPGVLNGVLSVSLCTQGNKHCMPVAQVPISFPAEAKHSYRLQAREQVNGANRFWVWVIDEASGAVVGGNAPDPAS